MTVDHILWDCKETEAGDIQNNIWDKGKDGMKQIGFFIESGLIEVHLGFLTLIAAALLVT
jgi:hypothetical protein